jgi:hypothetical protein
MSIQFPAAPPPPPPQTAYAPPRPVEQPRPTQPITLSAVPPSRQSLGFRDDSNNHSQRAENDRQSSSRSSGGRPGSGRGGRVDISV